MTKRAHQAVRIQRKNAEAFEDVAMRCPERGLRVENSLLKVVPWSFFTLESDWLAVREGSAAITVCGLADI
jgi:hypothetical protein